MKHVKQIKLKSRIVVIIIVASYFFVYFDKPILTMTTLNSLTEIPPNWQPIRVLTANVGNLSLACRGPYNNKLCRKSVEKAFAKNIQALQPDIVFLQELMHPSQCDNWIETDAEKVCFGNNPQLEPNQARRLLGKNYTILCASRMRPEIGHPVGMECIGIHINAGIIEECNPGELCFASNGLDIPAGDCNPEFMIMSTFARVRNFRMRLINGHPHSRNKYCRDDSLRQIFEGQGSENSIIAGDFNFDPFRAAGDTPEIWKKYVGLLGSGKPFYYHSGPAEHDPPYPTAYVLFQKKTIDHVISNFALGVCATLGEAPGTQRIDGGRGMDHQALLCDMWIPPGNIP